MTSGAGILEILLVVFVSSFFSFGGGSGPLAFIQGHWVAAGLLAPTLFAWTVALGKLTPGPKAGFLAGIGYYMHGWAGAAAALLATVLPAAGTASAASHGLDRLRPVIARIAEPVTFVVAGMIAAAAWGVAAPLRLNPVELGAAAVAAWLVGWRDLDALWVVLGGLAAGLLWLAVG